MKFHILTATSGLAFCALLGAANAQAVSGERVDANGMPTNRSTPAEQAETAAINNQVGAANAAADAQSNANNATYQAQQQQYQNQLQQNQVQQEQYQDKTARYNALRARYAVERAAYVRGVWPERYSRLVIVRGDNLIGQRVQLITGTNVGSVRDVALAPNGSATGLLVELDRGKVVWIDAGDVRYSRPDGIVMTNLDRADLLHMADQRL